MRRNDVNPWEWSKGFGFSQAVEVSGPGRLLVCSGQTGIGEDGSPPETADMGAQVRKAFENLTAVLGAAGLTMADVVRINYYTTDVDELIAVQADLELRNAIAGGWLTDPLERMRMNDGRGDPSEEMTQGW